MKQFLTILFVCGAVSAQTKSTTAAKSTTPAKKAGAGAQSAGPVHAEGNLAAASIK